ncbi:MAG: phosphatidylglycerophosphatase A [Paracoccaceae bacterium]|jgi:phosphatidylglycerophosphatase A
MSALIATFFYVGRVPFAPGTFGSAAAIPFGYLLHRYCGPQIFLLAIILVFLLGWWATAAHTKGREDHDPGEIVIDEVAGQWIALLPVSYGLYHAGVDPAIFPYPGWIAAFFLFRLFDIWKPWPIRWADNMDTPLGVMLDDVLAGIMAGLCVMILAGLYHGVLA